MGTVTQSKGVPGVALPSEPPTPPGPGNAFLGGPDARLVSCSMGEAWLPHGGRKVCPESVAFYRLSDSWSQVFLQQCLSVVAVFSRCIS